MSNLWNGNWLWTSGVRDFLNFQMPEKRKEVDEDLVFIDLQMPDKRYEVDEDLMFIGLSPSEAELGLAVQRGDAAAVEKLLLNSADVNARDVWGRTMLFHAINNGNLSIIALLLLAGADPTRTSHAGQSALDFADEKSAEALLKALAPLGSKLSPDIFQLDVALDALPEDLRERFNAALNSRRTLAI
mmetsp:Transcript_98827/g.195974  ORF Transcript_98827/g.195974 Transcript_98827/m.195974 type:complete len:187 (+) Transcript_98827:101-661(+)